MFVILRGTDNVINIFEQKQITSVTRKLQTTIPGRDHPTPRLSHQSLSQPAQSRGLIGFSGDTSGIFQHL